MKPLAVYLPMTDEDVNVWVWLACRWLVRYKITQLDISFEADRRDAELMLEAVQLLRCPIWSKRFASPPGGRMLDQMTMAREWVGL